MTHQKYSEALQCEEPPLSSLFLCASILPVDPCHHEIHYFFLLQIGEFRSRSDPVPFVEAASAAAGAGVLCLKYRMSAHRRLLSVILNKCRCKSRSHKILGMRAYRVDALFINILYVPIGQMKR